MTKPTIRRQASRIALLWALGVCTVLTQTGCLAAIEEFRAVAGPAVETGVTSIVDGLLEGFFALIEPDNNSA